MKKKRYNKRMLVALVVIFTLSMLAFISVPGKPSAFVGSGNEETGTVKLEENYGVDNQKPSEPAAHEHMLLSVFKFIVNCNPFRKETQL